MQKQNLRIVQLIDSLNAGGAEKMALGYAELLSQKVSFSALVTTRAEGLLKSQLHPRLPYSFLQRKGIIGVRSILKFRRFLKENNVQYVHAHSTSCFFAAMTKVTYPKIKIIWHDHFGERYAWPLAKYWPFLILRYFIFGIICVNQNLLEWGRSRLKHKKVIFLNNFEFSPQASTATSLLGKQGKRILLLANLRPVKNHLFLIEAAIVMKQKHADWTFHLVGQDFDDEYVRRIRQRVKASGLEESVFLYGARADVSSIIKQAEICVLTSISEGLPVSLVEYGNQQKAVAVTAVGEIPNIVRQGENGLLFQPNDLAGFIEALDYLIKNPSARKQLGAMLSSDLKGAYDPSRIMTDYLDWVTKR